MCCPSCEYHVLLLTNDHPDRESGEGEGVEAQHQVDIDDDAKDRDEGHTGHVKPRRAGLGEPAGLINLYRFLYSTGRSRVGENKNPEKIVQLC